MPDPADIIEPGLEDNSSGTGEFEPLEYTADEPSLHQCLGSAIYRHSFENGRRYHYFRNGKYPIPNDDIEQTRDDMKHALLLELTGGQLIHAPIGDNPQKIIDIGTGTVGDRYPRAEVVGVDLSPIQPVWLPPNVKFIIDDVEDEWLTVHRKYEYVHARNLISFTGNPSKLLARCYENMKPGAWIEVSDFGADVLCDDGTMPPDWPLKQMFGKLSVAMHNLGKDIQIAPQVGQLVEEAGFVNLTRKVYKVPVGIWPANRTLRLVGMYMRQVTEDFLDAVAAKPFRTLGMTEEEISAFMSSVLEALYDRSVHSYNCYYIWVAQKPVDAKD
ncbi:hypothetical protein CMQ_3149 [Grosmannia clavigera kw1407]|uniref:S-adenosyl-L-methionine-dependent methyltransferase n=1 Tax=Grosmannia clavigera (strain kw1407 / UAMH 11150) TaxID=655863 RepID=F0XGK1_GROCL|nr:uncharacterized protein CMQ_3149 [Grosmannia clavigera kw1407]EFX03220.1 hypothetical protein CMQ_3149 [Grosmannia clavigera kw1407]